MHAAALDNVSIRHDLMVELGRIEMQLDSGPGLMEVNAWQQHLSKLDERRQKILSVLSRLSA